MKRSFKYFSKYKTPLSNLKDAQQHRTNDHGHSQTAYTLTNEEPPTSAFITRTCISLKDELVHLLLLSINIEDLMAVTK